MSTLQVVTAQVTNFQSYSGTQNVSQDRLYRGSATAWANFNGITGTIRDSYNCSSITKTGSSNFVINFTNPLSNANYSALGMSASDSSTVMYTYLSGTSTAATTTGFQIQTANNTPAGVDRSWNSVAVFGGY